MYPGSPIASVSSEPEAPSIAEAERPDEPQTPDQAEQRQRRRLAAPLTLALLALNCLAWLATVLLSGPSNWESWLGLSPSPEGIATLIRIGAKVNERIHAGEYWRLITPIFLHGGLLHLFFNGLGLLMLGAATERIYGSTRFFVLFLFSGLCGSVASYHFSPGVGVGASGAVFGLAGVIIVFALRHRDRISARFKDEVRTVLAPMVILQLVIGFALPVLDTMAHLGGFLGGCLLASLVETPLAGPAAMARERLPVRTALLTGLLLVGYTGFSAAAHLQREQAHLRAGRQAQLQPALEYLRGLVRRQPELLPARWQLAEVYVRAGRWPEAAEQYREILDRDPANPLVRRQLGLTLAQAGQWDEAATALEAVVARLPEDAVALNALSYLYADTLNTRFPEAIALAQRAVKLVPREGAFWDTLGWAYYKNGQLRQAVEAQQQAVQLSGNLAEVRYHMGVIYQASGRPEAAIAEHRAALQHDPNFAPARDALQRLLRSPG